MAVLVAEIAECVLLAHSYGGRRIRSGGRPVGGTLHSLPAKEDVDLPCCSLHFGSVSSSPSSRGSRCLTLSSSIASSSLPGKGEPKAMPADHSRWLLPRICLGHGSRQGRAVGAGGGGRGATVRVCLNSRRVAARSSVTVATADAVAVATLAEVEAPRAVVAASTEAARTVTGTQTGAELDSRVAVGTSVGNHSGASLLRCRSTADGKVGRPDPQYRRTD